MLSDDHKLLRLYSTTPVITSALDRLFSVLNAFLPHYTVQTMTEKHLNDYSLLHIHKEILDDLHLIQVAQNFVSVNDKVSISY